MRSLVLALLAALSLPPPVAPAAELFVGVRMNVPAANEFCVRHPAPFCHDRPARTVRLTPARLDRLNAVNYTINRYPYLSDRQRWGTDERWEDVRSSRAGDCEDYVIAKYLTLVERGWPPNTLSIAIVQLPAAPVQLHAVLLVYSSSGTLVLDSLTDVILPVRGTTYRYLSYRSPDGWRTTGLRPRFD